MFLLVVGATLELDDVEGEPDVPGDSFGGSVLACG